MKEAILVGQYDPYNINLGGIEIYTKNLIKELNKHNYKVNVLGWSSIKKESNEFKPIVISNRLLGRKFTFNLFLKAPFISISKDIPILIDRPDRVIPFYFRKNKLVCFLHGSHYKNVNIKKGKIVSMFYRLLECIAFKRVDTVISVSHENKKYYEKRYPFLKNKIKVIPVGISEEFRPLNKNELRNKYGFSLSEKLVLYVGRLEKEKQVDQIIRSFGQIDAKLIIVGDGREESSLKNLAKELNLINVIFMKGIAHDHIPEIMNCADALVLFSKYEGMPTVVLEALACGKPVISSDVGDVRKAVIDNKTGFIANEDNFASYVNTALENPSRFQEECVRMASNYSWDKICEQTMKVLE